MRTGKMGVKWKVWKENDMTMTWMLLHWKVGVVSTGHIVCAFPFAVLEIWEESDSDQSIFIAESLWAGLLSVSSWMTLNWVQGSSVQLMHGWVEDVIDVAGIAIHNSGWWWIFIGKSDLVMTLIVSALSLKVSYGERWVSFTWIDVTYLSYFWLVWARVGDGHLIHV